MRKRKRERKRQNKVTREIDRKREKWWRLRKERNKDRDANETSSNLHKIFVKTLQTKQKPKHWINSFD